ncbi:MAG TPA: TetR family transcriptional regulator [Baekduia sp.]|uniref:TetR family transcriptional regulator n=1 Tax=Baekduia sp. TaxID=2600305 RepID=UPI002D798E8A|nr:TetR family transcriptional regulator [Baekduia sp.]HET6505883.1 TetR family transcriptional regulator [Baekduia sp.]
MSIRSPNDPPRVRAARKEQTRRRLLGAAHELLAEQGFTSLSLREVTRHAGVVPAAFYRHFDNLEALGLALVQESFANLNGALRAARAREGADGLTTATSAEAVRLLGYARENTASFRFVVRERLGGSAAIRAAITRAMERFEGDLALDLAREPALRAWSTEDIRLLASLLVTMMTSAVEQMVEAEGPAAQQAIEQRILRQLQMLGAGVRGWDGA